MNILHNRLLLGILGGISLYWGIGGFVPPTFVSQLVSVMLLVFGGFALVQHIGPAYRIIFRGERDSEEAGSHLSIIGTFFISLGLVFSGLFRFYVNNFDDWTNWIGSLTSNFSSVLIAVGMAFTFAAPQIDARGFRIDGPLRFLVGIVIAFAIGCAVTTVAIRGENGLLNYVYQENRPKCPADRPYWGSSRKVYHGPDSPYRSMITPGICFESEQEAIDSGFRKWK